jgi:hypothetical protein
MKRDAEEGWLYSAHWHIVAFLLIIMWIFVYISIFIDICSPELVLLYCINHLNYNKRHHNTNSF